MYTLEGLEELQRLLAEAIREAKKQGTPDQGLVNEINILTRKVEDTKGELGFDELSNPFPSADDYDYMSDQNFVS